MSTNNKLRQWRKDNRVTQSDVARWTGMSLYQVHRIETGKTRIALQDALAIEAFTCFQVSPRDLLFLRDPPTP